MKKKTMADHVFEEVNQKFKVVLECKSFKV